MSDDEATSERFRLVLVAEALPDRRRAEIRLRLVLKDLLRSHGLRCVSVEAVRAEAEDAQDGGTDDEGP
jgi:hypothetical protein